MPIDQRFISNLATLTLGPDETINIKAEEGYNALSVFNPSTSTGNCTITGKSGLTIGGKTTGNIVLTPGAPALNIGSNNSDLDIDDVTITTATGCTVWIVATTR